MQWRQSTNACKAEQQKWWAVLNSSYSSVRSFVSFDSSTKMAWKLELSPQQNRLNGSGFGILILLRHYPKKANINFGKARVPRVPAPVLMDFWFEVLELSHFLVVQKRVGKLLKAHYGSAPWFRLRGVSPSPFESSTLAHRAPGR